MSGRRTTLITGASSGFGIEFAKLFARDGFDLVLVARSGPAMQALADELQGAHTITATVIAKDLAVAGFLDHMGSFPVGCQPSAVSSRALATGYQLKLSAHS